MSISLDDKKITKSEVQADLKELKLNSNEIKITEEEISVRVSKAMNGNEVKKVNEYFEKKYDAKVNIGVISNVVKQELIKNAIFSVIIALFGIIIYISLRFKLSYAISGVVALIHDVLIIFSLFAIFRFEVSSMFIAAILAIIGYSINDTIVCFDRIRENLKEINYKKITKEKLYDICNESIRGTFPRSICTSITTLLPVVALIFLGSSGIFTFNMAMLFGLIAGTYSSIFIATSCFLLLEKKNIGKPPKQKIIYTDEYEEKAIKGVNC